MKISDMFTDDQIEMMMKLKTKPLILEEVIKPNFESIQKKCGQEMDPDYLAYLGEWTVMTLEEGGSMRIRKSDIKDMPLADLEALRDDLRDYRQECIQEIKELEEKHGFLTLLRDQKAIEFGEVVIEIGNRIGYK